MSLFAAMDSFCRAPVIEGENGHAQLDWSKDIEDRLVQFDFQCVRTNADGVCALGMVLDGLLQNLGFPFQDQVLEAKRKYLLTLLFKIIAKTRDINGGKGEYMLSYMMLFVWYHGFPRLVEKAISLFVLSPKEVDPSNEDQEPYGSWKDIKYMCKFVYDKTGDIDHPLIKFCIDLINTTLRQDSIAYQSTATNTKLSLVSKWIARESSGKFGFLYTALAKNYFPGFLATAKTPESVRKATLKCKTQYRTLCSMLNRHLDTVQIKQTAKNWAEIDHAKTTSVTMAKQRKAFLNQKPKGGEARSNDPDRIQCAENLKFYMESLKKEGKEVKGKNVGLEMFTAQARSMLAYRYSAHQIVESAAILDSQWRDNSNKKNANGLGPMVAVVDLSGSMDGDPMNAAIALGCRIAEKSILGKRVMTFSAEPAWIDLDSCNTFTEMVQQIMRSSNSAGLNTNFYKALDLILGAIEQHRVPPIEVENMILAILSDMQIDDNLSCMNGGSYNPIESQKIAARNKWATMHEQIKQKYADAGMRMYGVPLNPPHILFWNLRKTEGFPVMTTEAGCSMMSGFDPTILNMFCELGMEALNDMTPYKTLLKLLDNHRYLPMERIADNAF
jgi:hypothetical protein